MNNPGYRVFHSDGVWKRHRGQELKRRKEKAKMSTTSMNGSNIPLDGTNFRVLAKSDRTSRLICVEDTHRWPKAQRLAAKLVESDAVTEVVVEARGHDTKQSVRIK